MTLAELYDEGLEYLQKHKVRSPHLQAEAILIHVLTFWRGETIAASENPKEPLTFTELETNRARALFQSRVEADPIDAFRSLQPFCGIEVQCTPKACIPRPDSEVLVDLAIQYLRPFQAGVVYDVGTGTGAIAIALSQQLPQLEFIGTDITLGALTIAGLNHRERYPEATIEWKMADLLEGCDRKALAVVANLPYVRSEYLQHHGDEISAEPLSALDGGSDGLDLIRKMIPQAFELSPQLFLEVGPIQIEQVEALALEAGYQSTELKKDFLGQQRYLVASSK